MPGHMFPRRSVQGRVVLVTGGSTGIGYSVAARLAAGGGPLVAPPTGT